MAISRVQSAGSAKVVIVKAVGVVATRTRRTRGTAKVLSAELRAAVSDFHAGVKRIGLAVGLMD